MTEEAANQAVRLRDRLWSVPTLGAGSFGAKLRVLMLWMVFFYAVIAGMVAVFQRSLIYRPTRAHSILARHAGLGEDRVHDITVTTHDNLLLHGWHVLSLGRHCRNREECDRVLSEGRPLVLFFHGNGGNRVGRIEDCESFTGMSADVFIFDYRGYGENPGSPDEDSLAADARRMWNYATRERNVAADRIFLYGESLGGGVATRLATRLCEAGTPPAGLILAATFSSMSDVAAHHYPWLPVRLLLRDRVASDDDIPKVTCPILQIHGSHDRLVPIEMAHRLFAAAATQSTSGLKKIFVELPTGHNDLPTREFWKSIHGFIMAVASAR